MDYNKGKIDKILNDITDDVYIGSTCTKLSKRMSRHKDSAKRASKRNTVRKY